MSGLDAVRAALGEGRLVEAVDEARAALGRDPADAAALYLEALALSRLGSGAAQERVSELLARAGLAPALRADALALRGRMLKDEAARAAGEGRAALAARAAAAYEEALALVPQAFFVVNAATLQRLAGQRARSEALAREALRLLEAGEGARDHWHFATAGECRLLLGDTAAALADYRNARTLAGKRYGDLASMRRQLRLLAESVPAAAEALACVHTPAVVAFTGHMIDAPGRARPRFPPALEPGVAAAIERWLEANAPVIGYSQAACGADVLFAEALQRRGCETHITLPCATGDYIAQSVAFAGGSWVERFRAVLARATSVGHATAEAYLGDRVLFEHASRFIDGRTLLRARQLQCEPVMLAVLDAGAVGAIGGALETFDEWRRAGRRGEVIDVGALRREAGLDAAAPAAPAAALTADAGETSQAGRVICAMVFADVRGYSRLAEAYSPLFQRTFLGEARRIIDSLRAEFRTAQTGGDGLYATFATVPAAVEFSITLRDRVAAIDWSAFGLPRDTHVRVAVHCGPAFPIDDPVTEQPNFCGSHVSRTARIEPVVTPGEVFATEVVAAYLALQAPERYESDYLGVLPLAKGFGAAPLYRLRRAGQAGAGSA